MNHLNCKNTGIIFSPEEFQHSFTYYFVIDGYMLHCNGKGYIDLLIKGEHRAPTNIQSFFTMFHWIGQFAMPFQNHISIYMPLQSHIWICPCNDAPPSGFPVPCNMKLSDSNECRPYLCGECFGEDHKVFAIEFIYFRRVIVLYQSL